MESEIQKFYKNKIVFLTGGSGFLGKVYIEKILRTTDVEQIYLLIRPKRGRTIQERIADIFKDSLFERLSKLKPHSEKRIVAINGDCALPQLGLSEEDRVKLVETVDVVVHSAATVRFNEPLNVALDINVRATLDLIKLAKQMRQLKAFVHVSSAFANCIDSHIEERYYTERLNCGASKLCQLADSMGTEMLNRLSDTLCAEFPNTYCYTKALAEEAVMTQGDGLPICIFRPGIVIQTYSDPVAGWIDNLNGPTSILYGAAYGVLRVMYLRTDANALVVPVDYCANIMLASAWHTATSIQQIKSATPIIYNFVPDGANVLKWGEYKRAIEVYGRKMPLTKMIWFPFLITTHSQLFYKFLCFFYHTVPGYIFDFLLMLTGKPRRMVKTYRKIHTQLNMLEYFVERTWTFTMDNTKELLRSMQSEDRQLYSFDMLSIKWPEFFYNSLCGMRRYLSNEGPESIPQAKKLMSRLEILHRTVQVVVCSGGAALIWSFARLLTWL